MKDKLGKILFFAVLLLQIGFWQTAGASAEPEPYCQSEWVYAGAVLEKESLPLGLSSDAAETLASVVGVVIIIGGVLLEFYTEAAEGAEKRSWWRGFSRNKKKKTDIYEYQQIQQVDLTHLMVKDPEFSSDKFTAGTRELFLSVIGALRNKDVKELRPYVTGKMYDCLDKKILEYKNLGRKAVWERVMVNNAVITNYQERQNSDLLEVTLHVTMNHYVEDIKTKAILEGDLLGLYKYQYQMEFVRRENKNGSGKKVQNSIEEIHCPHCGAPIKVKNQTKCPYCKSIVMAKEGQRTSDQPQWLLMQMNGGVL